MLTFYEALLIPDINLSFATIKILGNYFKYDFHENLKDEHTQILEQIQQVIEQLDLLPKGLYVISTAIKKTTFSLNEKTIELSADGLIYCNEYIARKAAI